jgi:hypothetical protein
MFFTKLERRQYVPGSVAGILLLHLETPEARKDTVGSSFARPVLILSLMSVLASSGFGSPLSSKLLSLVPAGAEIVAGFENRHDPHSGGRLLLTTPNNRLDLQDWQALAGVDNKRIFDEVIQVATSPWGPELTEHLLLVAGRFDGERIFRAGEQNGAQPLEYQGQTVLLVKPFAREQQAMPDTRWLVILDNRIAMLGTPRLVQEALHRYANHAVADGILVERLTQLQPDVSTWNVLVSKPKPSPNMTLAKPHSVWANLLEDADVLMVGACFGHRIRVDFSIHAKSHQETAFFTKKAAFFSDVFATGPAQQTGPARMVQPRLENLFVEPNRVQGSIQLSDKEFDAWIAEMGRIQAPREPAPPAKTDEN